jgi:hypothetical protein
MAVTNEPFRLHMLELYMKLDQEYSCTTSRDILDMDIMSIETA